MQALIQLRDAANNLRRLVSDWERGATLAPEGRGPVELALLTMTMYWQEAKDVPWQLADREWLDAKRAHDILLRAAGDVGPLCRFNGTGDIPRIIKDLDHAGRLLGFLESPKPKTEPATEAAGFNETLTPEVRAILFVNERLKSTGQLPTKKAIAKALDVDRRTLDNWKPFKVAYAKLKKQYTRIPPKGTKSREGELEAWRESGK